MDIRENCKVRGSIIICKIKKLLKGLLISNYKTIQKAHDLGRLIALLQERYHIPEKILWVRDIIKKENYNLMR